MEERANIWILNFAFGFSIIIHIYMIFFLNEFNLNFLDEKKTKITITLSAIGTIQEEAIKKTIRKEKIIPKKIPDIEKIKKTKKKIKKRIDIIFEIFFIKIGLKSNNSFTCC